MMLNCKQHKHAQTPPNRGFDLFYFRETKKHHTPAQTLLEPNAGVHSLKRGRLLRAGPEFQAKLRVQNKHHLKTTPTLKRRARTRAAPS